MGGGRRRQAGRRAAKQANNYVPPSPSTQLGASGSVQRSCCQLLHDPWIAMQPPRAWAIHGQRNTTHGADSVSPTCSCRPLCKIRDDCYLETVPTDAPCRPVLSVTQTTFKSSHSHISLQQHYDTGHHPLHWRAWAAEKPAAAAASIRLRTYSQYQKKKIACAVTGLACDSNNAPTYRYIRVVALGVLGSQTTAFRHDVSASSRVMIIW